jgi:hypothetical protein
LRYSQQWLWTARRFISEDSNLQNGIIEERTPHAFKNDLSFFDQIPRVYLRQINKIIP